MLKVLAAAKVNPLVQPDSMASLNKLDAALSSGKAANKINDRLVRSALTCCSAGFEVPNPFDAPHNLQWYQNRFTGNMEVRVFATALTKSHLRVWSVAQTRAGYSVLVQVLGQDSAKDASETATLEAAMPSRRLRGFRLEGVDSFNVKDKVMKEWAEENAKRLLMASDLGHFVEIQLVQVLG
jgi:hypothetical protein